MTDKELDAYCWDWNRWCFTRKFFLAPGAKNILARMQPAKVGEPPNAAMSQDMSFFNMAIHALADMKDPDAECFVKYYAECAGNIKVVAAKMNIHRVTFYQRKLRFARKAYSMATSMKQAHFNSVATEKEAEAID